MASTYSTSSFVGFVSSKRRLQVPPRSSATPKFRQIDFAWPMCRYPLGSGGNRVATRPSCFPATMSSSTIARMKSTGGAAVDALSSDILCELFYPVRPPDRLRQGYGGPPKLYAKAEGGRYVCGT